MDFKRLSERVVRTIRERGERPQVDPTVSVPARDTVVHSVADSQVLKWFKNQLYQLCLATALHGYSQIVRKGYSPLERALWVIAVGSALVTAITLLWILWTWNVETPTVTVIESTNYDTYRVPFPAITICNLNKISASKALERAQKMTRPNNMTAEELAFQFRFLLHVEGLEEADPREYQLLHDILLLNNLEIPQLIGEFAMPCSTMLERCMWKGTQWRCDNLFEMVNSTEGLCCSFNHFAMRSSNRLQKKASSNAPNEPRRVMASGYKTGLSLILNPILEDYHSIDIATTGFKILIHSSFDFPDENAQMKIIASGTESFIAVYPKETYASDDALTLAPAERNCYQYNEVRMSVMQRYSYVNCMAECRASEIFRACKCLPFHLPSNGSLANCEFKDFNCLVENVERFRSAIPLNNSSITQLMEKPPMVCDCLPSCEMVQYPVEMMYGKINRSVTFNSLSFFKDIKLKDQSVVHIYFNDLVATRYRMDIYQNWFGVLASFGGILGLFLGFSIITGFEVIYFFSIRLLFDAAFHSDKPRKQ
ncbi:sodium channel protein Nach-like [Uranotaenia lowii]|uniref:sodium channel protein Nach-like n=1 Tax=Uranotaenia lowii TaxID=190385 RepID=UPI002478FA0E|nr:sodium channel protein Nach-like [Uranotaenia lowii]XP_055600010.1 sodium channel protein Nach-like [Uranotaenia lowii]